MIRRFADRDELSRTVAEELCHEAREAIARRGRFSLVLAGGHAPRRVCELLARPPCRSRVPWEQVDFFFADERAVPPDHPDSSFRMADETVLGPLAVPRQRIHRIAAELDADAAARAYEVEIARVLGGDRGGPPPAFDLVLLGLGTDGHTASPSREALDAGDRWVAADPAARPPRVAMTTRLLNAARRIWFLVSGADEAGALGAVFAPAGEPREVPARRIRPTEWDPLESTCRHASLSIL